MRTPTSFDYAVIRVVPRVERGEFINTGVIVFCRTLRFLGARVALDPSRLTALTPHVDTDQVERALAVIPQICAGDPAAGALGRLEMSARFHWLVAPRSTVVQTSPVHSGLCVDPQATLEHLLRCMVLLTD
ncbi:MAG: DUF3037 domain-containing protein [Chloroflexota bacterium]